MTVWLTIIGLLGVLFIAVFVSTAYAGAVVDMKAKPREPMEWCHKHGFFRRRHCLPMHNILICPRCYHEAISGAKPK